MSTSSFCSRAALTILLTGAMMTGLSATASASLAGRAGIWDVQKLETTMVLPDGEKAVFNLGAARTGALGHLDSDGVVDLVVAYDSEDRAWAAVSFGDFRFRSGPRHDLEREELGLPPEKAFRGESVVYLLPFAADWAAVGDWNGDGFFDVVFAAQGTPRLYWMAGDGQGRLSSGGVIEVEGGVTAFISADVNRRDGLDDLVVAVAGSTGPVLLVFESPDGALNSAPERLLMPDTVNSLAVGFFDADPWRDIAAAAGDAVVLISGRDRRLVSTQEKQASVEPAKTATIDFEPRVLDMVSGRFVVGDQNEQLFVRLEDGLTNLVRRSAGQVELSELGKLPGEGRMISARVSGLPGHDLVIEDLSGSSLEIYHFDESKTGGTRLSRMPAPVSRVSSVVVGRLNGDARDDLVLLTREGTVEVAVSKSRLALVVNTTDDNDDGTCDDNHCSLREAINYANELPAGSTITFQLGWNSVIEPLSELPALTQIGASSIDGSIGSFPLFGKLQLQGASAGEDANGIKLEGGNATVRNLDIRGFDGIGVHISFSDNNIVQACRIGVGSTGIEADGNASGVAVRGADNTIGGTADGEGNLISGNLSDGIGNFGSDTAILGNFIGTDIFGTAALGNGGYGVEIGPNGLRSQVGSGVPGGHNLISGNGKSAVLNFSGSTGALIIGNTIGLDVDGDSAIGNAWSGVIISSDDATIGGSNPNLGNVLSASEQTSGLDIVGPGVVVNADNVQVLGNFIGTDRGGTTALGNAEAGILVVDAVNVTIGGTTSGTGNVIGGNERDGIRVEDSTVVEILGNWIGIAADGTSAVGNGYSGVKALDSSDVTIGTFDAENIIANNATGGAISAGVMVQGSSEGVDIGPNSIHSNYEGASPSLGIDLNADQTTMNDDMDGDAGPNGLQNFPEILSADPATGTVAFQLNSTASTLFRILLFSSSSCDASGYGEGEFFLGGTYVVTGTDGNISDEVSSLALSAGEFITATATESNGNTSEFSQCFEVSAVGDHIFSDGFESGDTSVW